ncbi:MULTISPECIES: hypothetical protein [Bradyrhizobium]
MQKQGKGVCHFFVGCRCCEQAFLRVPRKVRPNSQRGVAEQSSQPVFIRM